MNIKSLITTSVVALISASAAQAADVVVPHEVAPVITAPHFDWSGFYIGAQVGNFSSKVDITDPSTKNKIFTDNETPKPSGFMGGIYAGSNIDVGNGLILGVETDAVWADRGETKSIFIFGADPTKPNPGAGGNENHTPGTGGNENHTPGTDDDGNHTSGNTDNNQPNPVKMHIVDASDSKEHFTFKEKWSGATRVRVGFAAADRIMPYFAGGIAYAQMQGIAEASTKDTNGKITTTKVADKSMTMVGFTIGGGVDFAMTDNILLRAEYRYSDFGKKKFKNDTAEFSYKTNDFRVGVAYKF